MKVIKTKSNITGIPDYFKIYKNWMNHYRMSDNSRHYNLALYYARVAEEMGQARIEDDDTFEFEKGDA